MLCHYYVEGYRNPETYQFRVLRARVSDDRPKYNALQIYPVAPSLLLHSDLCVSETPNHTKPYTASLIYKYMLVALIHDVTSIYDEEIILKTEHITGPFTLCIHCNKYGYKHHFALLLDVDCVRGNQSYPNEKGKMTIKYIEIFCANLNMNMVLRTLYYHVLYISLLIVAIFNHHGHHGHNYHHAHL